MKKFLAILLICIFGLKANGQLSSNMYLISNVNQHFSTSLYSALWGYKAPNGSEYAILGCGTGTAFIDITDSANVIERAYKTGPTSSWREMKVYSHYAYVVSEALNSGVQIFDLQYLPDSVRFVKTFLFGSPNTTHSISQSGPYLYLNGRNGNTGGILVLDLTTDPENPIIRGSWDTRYVHDCRVVNDTIYAADIYSGYISVINASNKSALTTIKEWLNIPENFPHNTALSSDKKFLFTTDETSSPPGRLRVWDINNLNNPIQVANWRPTGNTTSIVHNVETYGNYAVIAHYTAGVRVVNITTPLLPLEVAWYDTYPSNDNTSYNGCWGVYMFPSGKIIASDRQTGLYVVKTTFNITGNGNNSNEIPAKFNIKQNYPNPFNPVTTIEYSLPKSDYITLKIYDALGRQVAVLVDQYAIAGNYKINYDAGLLPSGIYFYKLSTKENSITKIMSLVK